MNELENIANVVKKAVTDANSESHNKIIALLDSYYKELKTLENDHANYTNKLNELSGRLAEIIALELKTRVGTLERENEEQVDIDQKIHDRLNSVEQFVFGLKFLGGAITLIGGAVLGWLQFLKGQ